MLERTVEILCELCGKPVRVRKRATGTGRFHRRCAQIARTLGRKNPNYKRGERSYHSQRLSPQRRRRIHERDQHRCCGCGRPDRTLDPVGGVKLDVHHVIPVAEGGSDDDSNCASLCRRCHNRIEHGRQILIWPPANADWK